VGHGQAIGTGHVILTQKGHRIHPGWNVGTARDCTLYSLTSGYVWFGQEANEVNPGGRKMVSVLPKEEVERREKLQNSNVSLL